MLLEDSSGNWLNDIENTRVRTQIQQQISRFQVYQEAIL